mmetsp:Transcript_26629/g.38582  ORF Transcript_26629/g.38582 Transcript_26629/m.38582 type:complete len:336 (-) Transcript_26629:152-1159(-)
MAYSNTPIEGRGETPLIFQVAEKKTACTQAGIETVDNFPLFDDESHYSSICTDAVEPGEQREEQYDKGTVFCPPKHQNNISRVSSIDWIKEFPGNVTDGVSYDDVFKDLPVIEEESFSVANDYCVRDDIFIYLAFVRHQQCLLPLEPPLEPSEEFLNKKRSGDDNLIPSAEWFPEYERQKLHVLRAECRDSESSFKQQVAEASSFETDETSVQSSLSSAITTRETHQTTNRINCIPTDNDVMLGRGGLTNHHPGNKRYRREADKLKTKYMKSTKRQKFEVSEDLVKMVKAWGGRFLIREKNGNYYEATKEKARKKASQALRESRRPRSASDEKSI